MGRFRFCIVLTVFCFSLPLSAGNLRVDGQLISDAPQGVSPLQVGSSTHVPNLNADLLDGNTAADFAGVAELATAGSGVGVHWKNLINLPVVEIDQDCALLTGCSTGTDSAGFPVTITEPGSYRLASNLATADEDDSLIFIQSSNVTLDLNGFALLGPVTCSDTPVSGCAPEAGDGSGVRVVGSQVESGVNILNGSIEGMGLRGIDCFQPCRISHVHVAQSGAQGISATNNAVVENTIAARNGSSGIVVSGVVRNSQAVGNGLRGITTQGSGMVEGCLAKQNGQVGIFVAGSVINSVAEDNTSLGFSLDAGTTATGNTARNNGNAGFSASAGVTLKENTAYNNGDDGFIVTDGFMISNNALQNAVDGFSCVNCLMLDNISAGNGQDGAAFGGANAAWGRNMLSANGNDVNGTAADMGNNICDGAPC